MQKLVFILNDSAIWLVNKASHNTKIHCRISLRRTCRPCGFTIEVSSRGHRLLIYFVKRITEIDGKDPLLYYFFFKICYGLRLSCCREQLTIRQPRRVRRREMFTRSESSCKKSSSGRGRSVCMTSHWMLQVGTS